MKKAALKYNKNIVSAFADNSGVMDFYDGYAISGKGETHTKVRITMQKFKQEENH